MSLFQRLRDAKKGCPFCNFEPCNTEKCMFFLGFADKDFDCMFLKIFGQTAGAQAFSHYATLDQPRDHLALLMQLSPESLTTRMGRIQETLEDLDATIAFPILPPEVRSRLVDARAPLFDYYKQAASALECVAPRLAKKQTSGTKKKSGM